ncbi:hypothetical protein VZT92_024656 [Zoarces viviparus]|uniref:Uncharacterized protein n=1 Tax=Zoarces viviparus TaxID=48416 RepID=A0AAW1E385_ZOAVI
MVTSGTWPLLSWAPEEGRRGEVGPLGMWGVLRGRERGKREVVGLCGKLRCAQLAKPPASCFWMTDGQQVSHSRQV